MNFKFSNKVNEDDNDDLILINEEDLKELKCGVCGSKLTVRVYTKGTKLHRKISCDKCNTHVWK